MSETEDFHGCVDFERAKRWRARPAFDVGEQIAFTRRNPWWKFWLPREVREFATVRKVWLDHDVTHVEAD